MTTTTDSGALAFLFRTLFADATLQALVNGEIHSALPEGQRASHLTKANQTCVSISLPEADEGEAVFGNAEGTPTQVNSLFWVDVLSLKGSSEAYCRQVAERISVLLGSGILNADYEIVISHIRINVMEDQEIANCWHASMMIFSEYWLY